MSRVIHFEINADDPERAAKFFANAFNWEIEKWSGPVEYWLITTGEESEPGINGAIKHRSDNLATVNTISVPSVDEFSQKITQAGGKAVTPKMAIPSIGYHAYCQDSEGNIFGIMQDDPSAT